MGRWAWVPSPCPPPRLSLLLLLLLLLVPRGAQPQAGRVSAGLPACNLGLPRPLWVLGLRPGRGVQWVKAGLWG